MRVPTNVILASWIRDLIKNGKLYKFYKTEDWLNLRKQVLIDNHWECSDCKKKQPAIYSKAVAVHHENEVKDRPELALSRTYRDASGVHENLTPLCAKCHNARHDRFSKADDRPQINLERW